MPPLVPHCVVVLLYYLFNTIIRYLFLSVKRFLCLSGENRWSWPADHLLTAGRTIHSVDVSVCSNILNGELVKYHSSCLRGFLGRYFFACILNFWRWYFGFYRRKRILLCRSGKFWVFSLAKHDKYRLSMKIICSGSIYQSLSACFGKKIPPVTRNVMAKR